MEEFKPIIIVGAVIAFILCSYFIYLIKRFEKKHPEIFTDKASKELKNSYHRFTMKILGCTVAYLYLFFGLIFLLAGGYSELIVIGGIGILLVLMIFSSGKK